MGKGLRKWYFVLQIEPGTKKIKELELSKENVVRKVVCSIEIAVGESGIQYRKRNPLKNPAHRRPTHRLLLPSSILN